ncbi:MAG TPA: site-2 protease family protein [Polyangiaceae bacterium]|nr:site-2 protease family protein [Polyangiaceae bacterium]
MAEKLPGLLIWYLVFLFSTTFHEFSHAFLAYKGGDLTAYETGHVTLDPLPHIRRSPFGMVLVPIFSYWQAGWMIGFASVPFNAEWGRLHPRRQALMSLAGPCANLLLALLALGAMRALLAAHVFRYAGATSTQYVEAIQGGAHSPLAALAMALGVMLKLNVALFLFNLIPVPPLDGAGVLSGFFPDTLGPLYERMRQMPAFEFLGLLLAWYAFPYLAEPAFQVIFNLLYR